MPAFGISVVKGLFAAVAGFGAVLTLKMVAGLKKPEVGLWIFGTA
jgi:hypothetical protein